MQQGKLIIITAPSGAGKTTIVQRLLNDNENLDFSVSACTREKREGETHGKDYYFITKDEFRNKVDQEMFVEWEEVYDGNYYGTLKSELNRLWDMDRHAVFDIDVRGALNIKDQYGDRAISIFIKPPSFETLVKRLTNRATENEDSLKKRIGKAKEELGYEDKFDQVIVNDILEDAVNKAQILVENFINR